MIFDPYVDSILSFCGFCCKCTHRLGSMKRQKILGECDKRITKELDILTIMRKLRDSYDLGRKLQSKNNLHLVRFEKKRVIRLDNSEHSSSTFDSANSLSSADSGIT